MSFMTTKIWAWICAILIMALLSTVAAALYYRGEVAVIQGKFDVQVGTINTMDDANRSLEQALNEQADEVNEYVELLQVSANYNADLNKQLHQQQQKLDRRDLLKIRSSRHGELGLKITNKSIRNDHKEWTNE